MGIRYGLGLMVAGGLRQAGRYRGGMKPTVAWLVVGFLSVAGCSDDGASSLSAMSDMMHSVSRRSDTARRPGGNDTTEVPQKSTGGVSPAGAPSLFRTVFGRREKVAADQDV